MLIGLDEAATRIGPVCRHHDALSQSFIEAGVFVSAGAAEGIADSAVLAIALTRVMAGAEF
jgi:hypothetical protein